MMWEKREISECVCAITRGKKPMGTEQNTSGKKPHREIARGVLYIYSVLGQDEFMETKIVLEGHTRPEMGPTTRARSAPM
jgi:hypothetical protein